MKRILEFPWQRWVLAAIVLLAMTLRYEGLDRPISMHPDELDIANWMESTRLHGQLKGITYPAGFFIMAEAARAVCEFALFRPWQRFLYLTGVTNRVDTHLTPWIFGRHFNVWLAGMTVILIYLLCRRISGSRAAGLFGAALFTFAPYHVEHSHYLETDIAMVALLALALCLWAWQAQTPRWRSYAAAAIATGYAVGTKTTLVFLVPMVVLFGLGWPEDERPGLPIWRNRRLAWRVLAGMALVGLGFVWSTPEALNIGSYLAAYRQMIDNVYIETPGIIGPAHVEPWARQLYLFRMFRLYLDSVGSGWLLLAAAGAPLLLTRGRRRFWPVSLLFPALYLYYFIFQAPWVRTQEFMNFLPSLAVSAAVAAAWMIDRAGRSRRATGGRALVTLLLFCLLVPTAQQGVAAASRCGWPDTRVLARSWLQHLLPHETTITAELQTSPATHGVARSEIEILQKVETQGLPFLHENGVDYFVRNSTIQNRGLIHPRTGALYPDAQAKLDAFRQGAELLRAWSAIEPERPFVSFRSPLLELWGLRPTTAGPALEVALPQPLFVSEVGRETYFPVGRQLGAAEGVSLNRYGRDLAVGGPVAPEQGVFVIVNTQGLPAQVNVKGFGRTRTADLEPFDAAAIPLRRPWWSPRFDSYERIRAWTRPQKNVVLQPCWLRVAFDATEAARLLEELGRPDRAWELLEANGGGKDPGLAFRIAVKTSRGAAAAKLAPAAAAQLKQAGQVLRKEVSSWRLNGLSAERYDEFARFRPRGWDEVETLTQKEGGIAGPLQPINSMQKIPLRLAGPWTMRMEVRVRGRDDFRSGAPKPDDGFLELRDESDRLLYTGARSGLSGPAFHPVMISMAAAARERAVNLLWTSPQVGLVEIRNIEFGWKLDDALRAWVQAQRIALARWHLTRGELPEALAARAAGLEPGPGDFDVDLRRLDLELALAQGDVIGSERAARRLLERAPRHYGALRTLAGCDPQSADAAETLAGEDAAVIFEPLVAIRQARIVAGRLRLVIEALRDDTPALGVALKERKFNRWREQPNRVVFSSPRALQAGERIVADLPIGRAELSRLGISIVSENPYVRGELSVRGAGTLGVTDLLRATVGI